MYMDTYNVHPCNYIIRSNSNGYLPLQLLQLHNGLSMLPSGYVQELLCLADLLLCPLPLLQHCHLHT